MQADYTYAIKNARGQIMATVSSPTARQAFWNAVLVVKNLSRDNTLLEPVYYAEPVTLQ